MILSACATTNHMGEAMRRPDYLNARPELPPETRKAILAGKVFVGMTKEEVIASWRKPYDINPSVGSWGVHEQWIYGHYDYYHGYFKTTNYLYLENSKLTGWQD